MSDAAVPLIIISIVVVIGITIFLMMNREDEDEDETTTPTTLTPTPTTTLTPTTPKTPTPTPKTPTPTPKTPTPTTTVDPCDGRLLNNTKNIALAKKCDLLDQDSSCYEISGMGLALKKLDKLSEADAKKCYPALKEQIESACYKRGANTTIKKVLGDFELTYKGRQDAFDCDLIVNQKNHPNPLCFDSGVKTFPFLGYDKLIESEDGGKLAKICYPDLASKIPEDKTKAKCKKMIGAELQDKTLEDFKTVDDAHDCKKITGAKSCYRLEGGKIEKKPLKYFMEVGANIDYYNCWKDDVAKEGKQDCFNYESDNKTLKSKKTLEEMSSIEQAKKCYRVPTTAKSECYGTVNGKFKKLTRDELRSRGVDVDKNLKSCYGSGQTEEEKKCWKIVDNNKLVKKQSDEVTNANDAKLCGLLPGNKGPSCYKLEYNQALQWDDDAPEKVWTKKSWSGFKTVKEAHECDAFYGRDKTCYKDTPSGIKMLLPVDLLGKNNELYERCWPNYPLDGSDTKCAKKVGGKWVRRTANDFSVSAGGLKEAHECGAIDNNYPIGCYIDDEKGFPEISFSHWMNHKVGDNYAYHHMLPQCYPGQCKTRKLSDFTSRSAAAACGRLPGDINCYQEDKPYTKWTEDWLFNNEYYDLVGSCYPGAVMPVGNPLCWVKKNGALIKIGNANDLRGTGISDTSKSNNKLNKCV